MTHRLSIYGAALLLVALTSARLNAQLIAQPNPSEQVIVDATTVLSQSMTMQSGIPQQLLAGAQGIVIVPNMIRGAFVFGAQYGRGVLVMRDAAGNWQAPRMIVAAGGSFGYQIGVQASDLVLVFRTPQSVANLLRGTIKLGVDASVAAGPVGRQTSAGTDLRLTAEILSYSRARGAFVGVSIDGTAISLDAPAEAIYYQPPGAFPASAMQLLQVITAYTGAAQPVAAPGQVASTTGWVPAGTRSSDAETTRQQLESSSRQLSANLDENWKRYLALPPEVYASNGVPNPQATQQALSRYEDVARRPEFAALHARPEFQQTLSSLRRLGEIRTASNSSLQLPPPPR